LSPLFASASKAYGLDPEGPAILAGLTKVESDFGRNMGRSSAGAIGWTQFMPETWKPTASTQTATARPTR
jgi:membrane-bound lytic murein transglycosylase B